MLRGSQLYNSLLFEQSPVLTVVKPERKGRSEALISKRNELIAARYWFYVKIKRLNYVDVLTALEDEVFLSQITLARVVASSMDILKKYQEEKPTAKHFAKEFPFMNWDC
jgi:hypothetical protein